MGLRSGQGPVLCGSVVVRTAGGQAPEVLHPPPREIRLFFELQVLSHGRVRVIQQS